MEETSGDDWLAGVGQLSAGLEGELVNGCDENEYPSALNMLFKSADDSRWPESVSKVRVFLPRETSARVTPTVFLSRFSMRSSQDGQ